MLVKVLSDDFSIELTWNPKNGKTSVFQSVARSTIAPKKRTQDKLNRTSEREHSRCLMPLLSANKTLFNHGDSQGLAYVRALHRSSNHLQAHKFLLRQPICFLFLLLFASFTWCDASVQATVSSPDKSFNIHAFRRSKRVLLVYSWVNHPKKHRKLIADTKVINKSQWHF